MRVVVDVESWRSRGRSKQNEVLVIQARLATESARRYADDAEQE